MCILGVVEIDSMHTFRHGLSRLQVKFVIYSRRSMYELPYLVVNRTDTTPNLT